MFNPDEEINNLCLEIYGVPVMEMRTREQYAREKLKRRYNFEPDSPGSNSGYIIVDGVKHKVHLQNGVRTIVDNKKVPNNPNTPDTNYMTNNGSASVREIDGEDSVVLGNNFFKLKSGKRRDAILQHEIAHKNFAHIHTPPHEDYRHETDRERRRTIRHINNRILPKNNKNPHLNFQEVEADRYAANRVSSKHVKRAIRNLNKLKYGKRSLETIPGIRKIRKLGAGNRPFIEPDKTSAQKNLNKRKTYSYEDEKYRLKSLKDSKVRNAKYLK